MTTRHRSSPSSAPAATDDGPAGGYYSRLTDIVSSYLRERRLLVFGAGAFSDALRMLVRMGLEVRFLDHDRVEWVNLVRTAYEVDDVGMYKVQALERHLNAANPFVKTTAIVADVCELSDAEMDSLGADVDLIIDATDSFLTKQRANLLSQRSGVPAVFIGVHAGGRGGRIIWSIPGESACYRCVAPERYEAFARDGIEATDTPGARGALIDIAFIDMIALKISLAILERGQDSDLGRFWTRIGRRNEVIVRTTPLYEFGNELWNVIVEDLPTTPKPFAAELGEIIFTMDSFWLTTEPRPGCPDCGGRIE